MLDEADTRFGQLAVDAGWATQTQVDTYVARTVEMRQAGRAVELGVVMVQAGALTSQQVQQLEAQMGVVLTSDPQSDSVLAETMAEMPSLPDAVLTPQPGGISPSAPTRSAADAPRPAPSAVDGLIGQCLSGKYEVKRKIGQGGMGAVYFARHNTLDRRCAIKILPPEMAQDSDLVERFRQEARACAQLDATHVVKVYDVDCDLGYEYLAMEYIEGYACDRLIKENKMIPWKQAVRIIRQAAEGLGEAHAKGIIHRDIKPGNIMLTVDKVVKVMDFGLARLSSAQSHLSRTGQILGTPHFMSPEQAQGEVVDPRTDIYSLGATLYYMVTGQTPFTAPAPTVLLLKVIDEEPTPPHELNPKLSPALSAVIARMMAKDPAQRHADTKALVAELDQLVAGGPVMAPPAPRAGTTPQTLGRKEWTLIGAVAGLLLLVAIGFAVFGGGDDATQRYAELSQLLLQASAPASDKVRACQSFLDEFPDVDQATQVAEQRDRYALEVSRAEALTALDTEVAGLIEGGRFDDAEAAIARFKSAHTGFTSGLRAADGFAMRVALARKAATVPQVASGEDDTWAGVEKLVKTLMRADRPEDARKALLGFLRSAKDIGLIARAKSTLTEIGKQTATRDERAKARAALEAGDAAALRDSLTRLKAIGAPNLGELEQGLARLQKGPPTPAGTTAALRKALKDGDVEAAVAAAEKLGEGDVRDPQASEDLLRLGVCLLARKDAATLAKLTERFGLRHAFAADLALLSAASLVGGESPDLAKARKLASRAFAAGLPIAPGAMTRLGYLDGLIGKVVLKDGTIVWGKIYLQTKRLVSIGVPGPGGLQRRQYKGEEVASSSRGLTTLKLAARARTADTLPVIEQQALRLALQLGGNDKLAAPIRARLREMRQGARRESGDACEHCDGAAGQPCPQCKGGSTTGTGGPEAPACPACKGKGSEECRSCRGKGKEECRRCGGRGKVPPPRPKHRPKGPPRPPRPIDCPECRGKGDVSCKPCRGKGDLTCRQCNGRKGPKKPPEEKCPRCRGERNTPCGPCSGIGLRYNPWRTVAVGAAHGALGDHGAANQHLEALSRRPEDLGDWRALAATMLEQVGLGDVARKLRR